MFLEQYKFDRTRQQSKKRISELVSEKSNYGPGNDQWSFTSIIHALRTDSLEKQKAELVLAVLDGLEIDGRRHPQRAVKWSGMPPVFMLHVISRQACHFDKGKNRIWWSEDRKEFNGMNADIVADHEDKPLTGDVVRCKIEMEPFNESGRRMSTSDQEALRMSGKDIDVFNEFDVNKNGIIHLGYPDIMILLNRNGERLSFPQFQKIDRTDRSRRKITNWFYREVFKEPRQKRVENSDTGETGKAVV